jgi:hypothetical protein
MPQTDPEERKNYNKEYYKKTRKPLTPEQKENKRAYMVKYREEHKEEIALKSKKPLTPEQKEKKRLYAIKYREEHKEELALKNKLEIEEMKRQWKEYIQTDEYKNKIADRKKAYEKIVASRKR